LKRLFNELEKELRSLTDSRIALEIKLDFLNTAGVSTSNSSNNVNIVSNSALTGQQSTASTVVVNSIQTPIISNSSTKSSAQQSAKSISVPTTPASVSSVVAAASNTTPVVTNPQSSSIVNSNISTPIITNANSSNSIASPSINLTMIPEYKMNNKINI
jgi:hypothetical protein